MTDQTIYTDKTFEYAVKVFSVNAPANMPVICPDKPELGESVETDAILLLEQADLFSATYNSVATAWVYTLTPCGINTAKLLGFMEGKPDLSERIFELANHYHWSTEKFIKLLIYKNHFKDELNIIEIFSESMDI